MCDPVRCSGFGRGPGVFDPSDRRYESGRTRVSGCSASSICIVLGLLRLLMTWVVSVGLVLVNRLSDMIVWLSWWVICVTNAR